MSAPQSCKRSACQKSPLCLQIKTADRLFFIPRPVSKPEVPARGAFLPLACASGFDFFHLAAGIDAGHAFAKLPLSWRRLPSSSSISQHFLLPGFGWVFARKRAEYREKRKWERRTGVDFLQRILQPSGADTPAAIAPARHEIKVKRDCQPTPKACNSAAQGRDAPWVEGLNRGILHKPDAQAKEITAIPSLALQACVRGKLLCSSPAARPWALDLNRFAVEMKSQRKGTFTAAGATNNSWLVAVAP